MSDVLRTQPNGLWTAWSAALRSSRRASACVRATVAAWRVRVRSERRPRHIRLIIGLRQWRVIHSFITLCREVSCVELAARLVSCSTVPSVYYIIARQQRVHRHVYIISNIEHSHDPWQSSFWRRHFVTYSFKSTFVWRLRIFGLSGDI